MIENEEDYWRYVDWQKHNHEVENMWKQQTDYWVKEGLLIVLSRLGIYPRKNVISETNKNQTEYM